MKCTHPAATGPQRQLDTMSMCHRGSGRFYMQVSIWYLETIVHAVCQGHNGAIHVQRRACVDTRQTLCHAYAMCALARWTTPALPDTSSVYYVGQYTQTRSRSSEQRCSEGHRCDSHSCHICVLMHDARPYNFLGRHSAVFSPACNCSSLFCRHSPAFCSNFLFSQSSYSKRWASPPPRRAPPPC